MEAAARDGFRGFKGLKLGKRRAGKGQAATLEQQRLTARGLGGSCREEAMQQLEDCKGGGRWRGSTPPVEGFRGFKRLKAGKRQARMPYNKRGLCAGKGQAAMLER